MSSPRKQLQSKRRWTDEWVADVEDSSTPSTPKKRGASNPSPATTPSRSSRSQGLINHIQKKAFRRSDGTTFSVGDQVVVGPGAAPHGRPWLHEPKVAKSPGRRRREGVDLDDDEGEDAEPWGHRDGLERNEKVAVLIGLWEDERGEKWAKVRWFARPGMMWGDMGPPDWAPQDYLPYEVCYVHDSDWYASRNLLDSLLAKGKRFHPTEMTGKEYAECSKCTSTTSHAEDSVRVGDVLARVVVRAASEDDEVAEGEEQEMEKGLRVFRCRRLYDSRPQAWNLHGFVKPLPHLGKGKRSRTHAFDAIMERGGAEGKWDLPVEKNPCRDDDEDDEEKDRQRSRRVEEIKERNRRKREEEARMKGKGKRKAVDEEEESEDGEVMVARRVKATPTKKARVEAIEEDDEEMEHNSTEEDDDREDDYEDAGEEQSDEELLDPTSSEEEADDDDEDFGSSPTKSRKFSSPRKRGLRSPAKPKRARPNTTAAQRAKTASIRSRRRLLLARRRTVLPRGALDSAPAPDDPALRDPFARARAMLHVSATPDELPCRDGEFADVEAHLEEAIEGGTGSCIYIAGVPGTGKTATVHSVVRHMRQRVRNGDLSRFRYFEINGMKVTEPNQSYVLLWEYLSGGERCSPRQAQSNLDSYFNTPSASRETCVVLVDELDQLVQKNTKNEVIYNFFNWPNQPHSRLIVLAIANKMDMPETDLSSKINSRLGSNRITFRSYTEEQLIEIVRSRLSGLGDVFSADAIKLACRRTVQVVGDARKALDMCRRAAEVVEAKNHVRRAKGEPPVLVTPNDIQNTYRTMVASGKAAAITRMSLHQQALLVAISKVVQSKGVPEVEIQDVIHRHAGLTTQTLGLPLLSHDDVFSVLASLQALRLISCEDSRLDYFARVKTDLNDADLKLVLNSDERFGRVLQTSA